jgi:hypothetical protein
MPDVTARNRMRDKQKIPRIERKDAARIFEQLEHFLEDCGDPVASLRSAGFAQFLTQIQEPILQLAVQPGSWGERTRARLVSAVIRELKGTPPESASVEEVVTISNIVTPCLLLELGRRKQHLAVEFPKDPCDPCARFGFSVSPSEPMHSISNEELTQLVIEVGEDLVGLCYFGDRRSRDNIEAELNRDDATATSKTKPCRSSSSSAKTKP